MLNTCAGTRGRCWPSTGQLCLWGMGRAALKGTIPVSPEWDIPSFQPWAVSEHLVPQQFWMRHNVEKTKSVYGHFSKPHMGWGGMQTKAHLPKTFLGNIKLAVSFGSSAGASRWHSAIWNALPFGDVWPKQLCSAGSCPFLTPGLQGDRKAQWGQLGTCGMMGSCLTGKALRPALNVLNSLL